MTDNFFRINTRVSRKMNDWLDERAMETGMSKSALVNLALENYFQQQETISTMGLLLKKIEELEKKI